MICSSLTRKVFEQTSLNQTIDTAWWVEQKLQLMKINGLVKMVQGSPNLGTRYIDGYLPKFKWALRPIHDMVSIEDHRWLFDILQNLVVDFPWNLWRELSLIPETDAEMLMDSVYKARDYSTSLNYVLSIYRADKTEIVSRIFEREQMIQETIDDLQNEEEKQQHENNQAMWNRLKEMM